MKCFDEKGREIETPTHLRDDAKPRMCTKCGRKSWAYPQEGATCGMTQPDGSRCDGDMR